MNKQDMMKIQTCVLRVNIHCEGCKHKVKKQLQKVEGVYKVSIDVDQGKVTVSGNIDPSLLIKKLEKAGKHAELWAPQKGPGPGPGPVPFLNTNQFKNIQFDNMKDGKAQKVGFQVPQQMQKNQKKGAKDEKPMGKEQKSVKFKLPEDEEEDYDDDSDEFDDEDDQFDDESDEGFGGHEAPVKAAAGVHGPPAKKGALDGHAKGSKNGGKGKKGGGINSLFKGMLGKVGGKNGGGGKDRKKGGSKKEDGSKDKKNGGFPVGDGKNAAVNGKGAARNGGWKGGEDFGGGQKMAGKQKGFNEMNAKHKGSGGGGGGWNKDMMGQMGGFPAAQGLPAAAAMNGGRLQGMGPANPYNQQYMAPMMMINQQRGNGLDGYNQWAYVRPHPAMAAYGPSPMMGYGPPPPATDQYTHMFNDENTDSCSIM